MLTILIIDDQIALLEAVVEGLALEGFIILQASDGYEGIQLAREAIPDIIICDINMPEMSGFEVLETLRKDSLTAAIPFIFLSARSAASDIRTGMNYGADDYLTKPVNYTELIKAVRSRLARNSAFQVQRLREYAHRLVIAQEQERRNFAAALRSNLGDTLSDIKVTLEMLRRLPPANQASTLQTAERLIQEAVTIINNLSHSLMPSTLMHIGILPALLLLVDQVERSGQIHVEFIHQGMEDYTDLDFSINVYRIVQEALTNVQKHAGVNTALVRLWAEGDFVHLQIEDNGVGFDVESVLNSIDKIGVITMRERAYLLNGELTILSSLHAGTRIYGRFPMRYRAEVSEIENAPADYEENDEFPPSSAVFENGQPFSAVSTLTDREKQILLMVVNGATSQEIADKLVISTRTVETHRLNMMRKLGLRGMPALMRFAVEKGLIGKRVS